MYEEAFEVYEESSLDFQNEFDIPEVEPVIDEEREGDTYFVKEIECVADSVPIEYKRNAVEFWRSGTKKSRTLATIRNRFRKVTSLRQLRRWEQQVNQSGSRFDKLKKISTFTLNKFHEGIEKGIIIHDIDIARWAIRAQKEVNLLGFTASLSWVKRFKLAHNIVSRKITKFITKKHLASDKDLEARSKSFIENVKSFIIQYGIENVYNSDQSGFQLEFHFGRSLSPIGIKKVERIVQSISATTHSYTIQPIVSADGRLLSPLFIVLKEPTGTFVKETMFKDNNIFVMASKSGKLTSHHFEIWIKEVFFPNVGPKSVLLLDSWTGHCPDIIQRNKPDFIDNINLLTIPAGATGKIQPLDVFGFRLWKNFVRHFSDTIMLLDLDVKLHSRNNILKLQSLTHNQFSSPRFKNLFKYAWYKSGYLEKKPEEFDTPVDFCFKINLKPTCDICGEIAVISCAWCKKSLCINHFFHDHHLCNRYQP
ncbi:uncharacterized protein LOC114934181 [Nylanderia fulva]|uniref:uncharacterized protein LOC114934181 n=1 Tax=Nylanderia fulva TaxID=613905 RepID=UPI0010FB9A9E|nr:uncharacterized protein LOC114934181 [Nylanderia fulva]